jgi:hypothetical protein
MDINRFNAVCQSLRRQQFVHLQLSTGELISGFIVSINLTTNDVGSIELATARGVESFLSSTISDISGGSAQA